jgi:hypothetical protein
MYYPMSFQSIEVEDGIVLLYLFYLIAIPINVKNMVLSIAVEDYFNGLTLAKCLFDISKCATVVVKTR